MMVLCSDGVPMVLCDMASDGCSFVQFVCRGPFIAFYVY